MATQEIRRAALSAVADTPPNPKMAATMATTRETSA